MLSLRRHQKKKVEEYIDPLDKPLPQITLNPLWMGLLRNIGSRRDSDFLHFFKTEAENNSKFTTDTESSSENKGIIQKTSMFFRVRVGVEDPLFSEVKHLFSVYIKPSMVDKRIVPEGYLRVDNLELETWDKLETCGRSFDLAQSYRTATQEGYSICPTWLDFKRGNLILYAKITKYKGQSTYEYYKSNIKAWVDFVVAGKPIRTVELREIAPGPIFTW